MATSTAQRGPNVVDVERLAAFARAPLAEITDYGERRMRAALAALEDGTWTFEDQMDSCGRARPAASRRPQMGSAPLGAQNGVFEY
jgi:hypothetical protein